MVPSGRKSEEIWSHRFFKLAQKHFTCQSHWKYLRPWSFHSIVWFDVFRYILTVLLAHGNSSINCVVYAASIDHFRTGYLKILGLHRLRRKKDATFPSLSEANGVVADFSLDIPMVSLRSDSMRSKILRSRVTVDCNSGDTSMSLLTRATNASQTTLKLDSDDSGRKSDSLALDRWFMVFVLCHSNEKCHFFDPNAECIFVRGQWIELNKVEKNQKLCDGLKTRRRHFLNAFPWLKQRSFLIWRKMFSATKLEKFTFRDIGEKAIKVITKQPRDNSGINLKFIRCVSTGSPSESLPYVRSTNLLYTDGSCTYICLLKTRLFFYHTWLVHTSRNRVSSFTNQRHLCSLCTCKTLPQTGVFFGTMVLSGYARFWILQSPTIHDQTFLPLQNRHFIALIKEIKQDQKIASL